MWTVTFRLHDRLSLVSCSAPTCRAVGFSKTPHAASSKRISRCEQDGRSRTEVLGAQHISTLDTSGDMGDIYGSAGRLKDATNLSSRVLRDSRTLDAIVNLGDAYIDKGRISKIKVPYVRAAAGQGVHGDHAEDIRYLEKQLSLLVVIQIECDDFDSRHDGGSVATAYRSGRGSARNKSVR